MTNVTVIVFLLEYFPGFEIKFNATMQSLSGDIRNFHNCDPYTSDSIWKNIKTNSIFKMNQSYIENNIEENNEIPLEANITIVNKKFYEKTTSYKNNYLKNGTNNLDINSIGMPYLVAIFETLNNITAQTCGGTILSAQWVITPATCLDLLYNYINGTKLNKENKLYSVIANANNPLEDGTLHNVTEIFLHPYYKKLPNKQFPGSASLALLKIEPAAVSLGSISIFMDKPRKDIEVKIYGWILKKNSTGQDAMSIASFTAKTLNSNECKSNNNLKNLKSVICLHSVESKTNQISQMNSGGPVVIFSKNNFRILGVVELDMPPNLIVHPLAPHYEWISSFMNIK